MVVGVTIPILKITVFSLPQNDTSVSDSATDLYFCIDWDWWRKPDNLSYELLPFPAEQENAVSFGCHAGTGEK